MRSLENGDPKPLLLYLDGGDINTADAVEAAFDKVSEISS